MSKKSSKKAIVSSSAVIRVTLEGTTYIGTLKDNTLLCVPNQSLVGYVKARETGELQPIIIGNNNNIVMMPITPEEQLDLDRLESLWTLAEAKSKSWVTSQVFAKLTGK